MHPRFISTNHDPSPRGGGGGDNGSLGEYTAAATHTTPFHLSRALPFLSPRCLVSTSVKLHHAAPHFHVAGFGGLFDTPLPENRPLPRASVFAESKSAGSRQR